jgi:uncharacterized protein involved in type VI secretion and phage assembly
MESIVGVMKKVAEQEAQRIHTTELGVVTAVFPHADKGDKDNYQCSVKLKNKKQPDGSDFELRKVPVATPYLGLAAIPNVGDLVLVSFIGGDINAPVIMGRLYNDEDRPPANKAKEFLLQHDIQEGGSIKLDEEGKIIITSKDTKNVFTLENEKISVVNEKFSLVIDISGEKISILSDKDLEMSAKNGKFSVSANEVEIKSQKDIKVESGAALNLKSTADTKMEAGAALNLKATSDAKLEASANVNIKATANLSAEGTAGATLKNAAAQVALSGPSVNINNGALEVT